MYENCSKSLVQNFISQKLFLALELEIHMRIYMKDATYYFIIITFVIQLQ